MEGAREPKEQGDLATRIFAKPYFAISWVAFLGSMFLLVGWPMRNVALVCWAYGPDGYFERGIRVLPGKPIKFSDGELVPLLPDVVTGFGAFFMTVVGLTLLAILALRLYERRHGTWAAPDD